MNSVVNRSEHTKDNFKEVMNGVIAQYPSLTIDGLGIFESYKPSTYYNPKLSKIELQQIAHEKQSELFCECNEDAFRACDAFIRDTSWKPKDRKKPASSYVLKHEVERWAKSNEHSGVYVPTGIFVAAALYHRLKLKFATALQPYVWLSSFQ